MEGDRERARAYLMLDVGFRERLGRWRDEVEKRMGGVNCEFGLGGFCSGVTEM